MAAKDQNSVSTSLTPVKSAELEHPSLRTIHHICPAGLEILHILSGQAHIVLAVCEDAVFRKTSRSRDIVIEEYS